MTRSNPWLQITSNLMSLGLDAAAVISLRTMKIALGGPAAETETHKMINEKIEAASAIQRMAWSGALGSTGSSVTRNTIAHYHRKVRANRKRLSKR